MKRSKKKKNDDHDEKVPHNKVQVAPAEDAQKLTESFVPLGIKIFKVSADH